jgi:hypothetical protein
MRNGKGRERHDKPEPEDLIQTSAVNEDGSVLVTTSFTGRDGELHGRTLTIADNEDGGVVINTARADNTHSKTVIFSEDLEDNGIDIDISFLTTDGEAKSRHVELDLNEDGTLTMEVSFEHDGEEITRSTNLELAKYLGEEGEQLTMTEVIESYLDRGHLDATSIDLTGLNNIATDADLIII